MTATINVQTSSAQQRREVLKARSMAAVERLGLPLLLVVVIFYFSLSQPDTFPTFANVQSIMSTQSVLAILAIGAVLPFVTGQFDLSLPATLGLTHLVAAILMRDGHSLVVAVLGAVILGAAIGMLNGVVVTYLGVNSIITTLGVASLAQGFSTRVSDGATIATGISPGLLKFGYEQWFGIPKLFFLVLLAGLLVGYVLTQTPIGRAMEAVGVNSRAARLVGIRERRLTIGAFVMAGGIAGVAGVAQVAAAGSASPTFGPNLLLPVLTAVFLGATTIKPGRYSVSGTLIAVVFLAASLSGLALAGVPSYIEPIYNGSALILAVSMSTLVRRRRTGESASG